MAFVITGDAATTRTNLGLGTAATLDVGSGANNIVQLDGSGNLPALDGSALTGLAAGILQMKVKTWYVGGTDYTLPNGSPQENFTISMTPTSSSSTILHMLVTNIKQNGSDKGCVVNFYRDGTQAQQGYNDSESNLFNVYLTSIKWTQTAMAFSTGHTAGTAYDYKVYFWTTNSDLKLITGTSNHHILIELDNSVASRSIVEA